MKVNALEEAVLAIGQEVQNLKVQFSTRCHASYKYICVTPLKYNTSFNWNATKNHLLGVWKDNDISHDIKQLQEEISTISKAHLDVEDLGNLAESLKRGLQSLNPFSWLHTIITIAIFAGIILFIILIFPVFLKIIYSSVSSLRRDIHELHLKNKKGRDVTPPPVEACVRNRRAEA